MKKYLIILISLFCFYSGQAFGIPAFARTYKTSCVTCHNPYPRLNEFGESFRIAGFQIPNDEGESIKEEPLSLGDEAYKRVWPKAVWPGEIPGSLPIAFRAKTGFHVTQSQENSVSTFGSQFQPPTIQIMMAGTMGEKISFFAGAHLFESGLPGTVDRLYLKFNSMLTSFLPADALAIRIGQFIPEIVTFASNHRAAHFVSFAFNTYSPSMGSNFVTGHVHEGESFGIESFQIGLEASGVIKNRLRYVAGVVNGTGPNTTDNNNAKDVYGRVALKIGSYGYFQTSGDAASSKSGPHLIIGGFGYKGSKLNTGYIQPENLNFFRAGSDLTINFNASHFLGGFIYGRDEKISSNQLVDEKYSLYFLQLGYDVYPWLIPLIRWEEAFLETGTAPKRFLFCTNILPRANIRIMLELPVNMVSKEFEIGMVGLEYSF